MFRFPNPVNEKAARTVAAGVVVLCVLTIVLTLARRHALAVADRPARVRVPGPRRDRPTLSPLGQLATRVIAPRLGAPREVARAAQALRPGYRRDAVRRPRVLGLGFGFVGLSRRARRAHPGRGHPRIGVRDLHRLLDLRSPDPARRDPRGDLRGLQQRRRRDSASPEAGFRHTGWVSRSPGSRRTDRRRAGPPPAARRERPGLELLAVLGVSLGMSGIYALLSLIRAEWTVRGGIGSATATVVSRHVEHLPVARPARRPGRPAARPGSAAARARAAGALPRRARASASASTCAGSSARRCRASGSSR